MLLTGSKTSEVRRAIYNVNLPALIKNEVYPKYPKALRGGWRIGQLHYEWNSLWNEFEGIIIKAPRNHLKTFFFFESNALRLADEYAGIEILYMTSTDPLAIKKLDNVKKLAKVPYFKHLLEGADVNNKTQLMFGNGSRIDVQGFNSKGRGGHPDVIILDDIIDIDVAYSEEQNAKSKERVATEILPMLSEGGRIVIIGTLQREDDIYSIDFSSLETEGNTKLKWVTRTYDAIVSEEEHKTLFPEKWSWDALMAKKAEIIKFSGERFFNKEYRNMPVNLLGEIIKPEWKRTYREMPAGLSTYTGWDLSVGKHLEKGDFAAKVTFCLDPRQELPNIYIKSVVNERLDFPKRVRKVITDGENESPVAVGIEDNVFQEDTVQTAKKNSSLNIVGVTTLQNKTEKFVMTLAPLFENGRVFMLEGDAMQQKFWEQLTSLPRGTHDDMADAFCNGLKVVPFLKRSKASDFVITL